MNILIVDDSLLNLKIAKDILVTNNIKSEIIMCSSGMEALKTMEAQEIDIVLLDIMMPEMDGIEVLARIRKNKKYNDIMVIMLTALNDLNVFKQCFDIGANEFLYKPINQTEFIARIKAAINSRMYKKNLYNSLEELEKQNMKLQEAMFHMVQKEKMAAIGGLAAGIAHEINNPLGYITSNLSSLTKYVSRLELIIKDYKGTLKQIEKISSDNKIIVEMLESIKKAEEKSRIEYILSDLDNLLNDTKDGVEKVSKIVQTLGNFAKDDKEEGKSYHDINNMVEEVLLIVNNETKGLVSFIKGEDTENVLAYCNRSQVESVIINIVMNAVHAIRTMNNEKDKFVKITTGILENQAIFSIADNGPGIEKEALSKIFNPFFSTRDVGEGIGLGLSISYDIIVNKHNGELTAESVEDIGSVFKIKLPLQNN